MLSKSVAIYVWRGIPFIIADTIFSLFSFHRIKALLFTNRIKIIHDDSVGGKHNGLSGKAKLSNCRQHAKPIGQADLKELSKYALID